MRPADLKSKILLIVSAVAVVILLLMPFHAFLTVWGSAVVGHYTALRLWKDVLLLISLAAVGYLWLADRRTRQPELSHRLIWLYAGVNIIWGVIAYGHNTVSLKALGYGLIINLRFLGFFLVTWAIAARSSRLAANWQRLVLWPASVVVIFGLLQVFCLPSDFLKHFGYNLATIPPFETINNNPHYVRIIATLRGANPLGAYLIIPISALTVLSVRGQRRWRYGLLLLASLVTLYFSFSRSAWLGAVFSVAFILALSLRSGITRKTALLVASGGLIVFSGLLFSLRHDTRVQNILFHTQTHSAVATTSDQGHTTALRSGLNDLLHEPLGRGPGSAGPASVYNNHPARIAENYYIQIGQELGWLGLIIFLMINLYLAYMLWLRRGDTLALTLLASLVGISLINMLSHAWTDDTLAYIWWGLAGVAMADSRWKLEDGEAQNKHDKD